VTIPGNPAPLVKASLVSFLNGEARVVRDVPDSYLPKSGPMVLVADDGGPMEWPVLSKNTIRVTVLGDGMTLVRDLAGRCLGHIFDDIPNGLSHINRNGTTLLEGRDPRTGADFCSFTVTATVRTTT
jgi:hypothetical protein